MQIHMNTNKNYPKLASPFCIPFCIRPGPILRLPSVINYKLIISLFNEINNYASVSCLLQFFFFL